MKSIYLAILGCCLGPLLGQATLLGIFEFDSDWSSTKSTNNPATGAGLKGLLKIYTDKIVVDVTNVDKGHLVGLGVLDPFQSPAPFGIDAAASSVTGNGVQIGATWKFKEGLGNMMNGGSTGIDKSDFYLSYLDTGGPGGPNKGVADGKSAKFTFMLDSTYSSSDLYAWLFDTSMDSDPYALVARFQSVQNPVMGAGDSDKLFLKLRFIAVPEPSDIAFLGVGMLLFPIGLRQLRSRKKQR